MAQTNAKPGISTVVEPDWMNGGRDMLVILDRHQLPPHHVVGRVEIRTLTQLRGLRTALALHEDDWMFMRKTPRGKST
ncbi:hypothetical protein ACDP63_16920 [Paracoccus sp. P2]|uniref:hypothetical protein n=1 Tax=Paracoccus sp. P2 TaxID=3248840 RepID=UPI00391F7CC2